MAFNYIQDEYGHSYACDGICFDPDRVKSEIFTLQGAYKQYSEPSFQADYEEQMLVLKDISRCISTIALHSRLQITSYFQRLPKDIPHEDKIELLKKSRTVASRSMVSNVGYTQKNLASQAKELSFYDAIGHICHVEKWRFPVSLPAEKRELFSDCSDHRCDRWLLLEVTKRGKTPVTGHVEYSFIDVPTFAETAYKFVSDCPDCMQVIDDRSESLEPIMS